MVIFEIMKHAFLTFALTFFVTFFGFSQTENPPPVVQVEKDESNDEKSKLAEDEVVDFPDKEARFRGRKDGLSRYINSNVKYPEQAIDRNISGKVYLSFIIEKNGEVSTVKIEKSVHPVLDKEALRLVQNMPKWKPAKVGFRKVRSRCRLPIVFTLR